jgi:hypothetical protein
MTMNIDPTHIAWRCGTAEQTQTVLNELEAELALATSRRSKILADINKANTDSIRDQRARLSLPALNKEEAAVGRLIRSIEHQVGEAKKRLAMVQAAEDNAARARAPMPATDGPERLFLVKTPRNGQIRHKAQSVEQLRARLLPGYVVAGQIFGANDDGSGGIVAAIEPTGPSIMAGLLQAHGAELLEYLAQHGVVVADKQSVVALPNNGRELQ